MTRTIRRRLRIVLAVTLALTLAAFCFRISIRRWIFAAAVVRKDGPSEAQLSQFLREQSDPADALVRLWSSTKMPQRHFVMNELRTHAATASGAWQRFHPLVLDAAASRDVDLLEPAMTVLCRNDSEEAARNVGTLLNDADPDVRIVGLRAQMQLRDFRFAGRFIDCLDDPEHSVRVQAYLGLSTLTRNKFEVNLKNEASVETGMREFRGWALQQHFPSTQPTSAPAALATTAITAPDFSAVDLLGHAVRLSSLRGKPVLLNFWATWCGPCRAELPDLVQFQNNHPNDIHVLGICTDTVKEDDGDGGTNPAEALPKIQAAVQHFKISYPTVVDKDGAIVAVYDGSGVPLSVLIDETGIVRRRFLGPRSLAALEKMLAALRG